MIIKKIINATLLCTLVIGLTACDKSKTPDKKVIRTVKSMLIKNKSANFLRSFPGKVLPSTKARLSFEVPGKIELLSIKKGENVKKGTLLSQLEKNQYEDKVKQAKAKFRLADSQYKRGKALMKGNYISQSDLDKLQSRFEVTKTDLDKANRDLGDTQLIAPFDGIISNTYVEQHERVQAKQKILDLHDITQLDVQIDVPENVMLRIKKSKKDQKNRHVIAIFDAFPKKQFTLTFKEFSSQADQDTQTYAVIYTMPQPDNLNVLPGMSVTVKATITNSQAVASYHSIPSSAVFTDSKNNALVWVIDPKTHTVSKQKIQVKRLTGDQIQVLSGLQKGQTIVTAGVHFLQPGQKVKPLNNHSKP